MLHVYSEALQAGNQDLLLLVIQHILGVEDGWRVEYTGSLCWVLLKSYIGENGLQLAA